MENIVYFVVDATEQEVRETASAMEQTAREISPVLWRGKCDFTSRTRCLAC